MKKKYFIILIIIGLMVVAGFSINFFSKKNENVLSNSQCQAKEMTFYYLDTCGWCQKVKSDGTIDKIEALGVKVNKINAAVGPIRHQFQGVPTFVINKKVYSGYKTFEELKELLGCPKTE